MEDAQIATQTAKVIAEIMDNNFNFSRFFISGNRIKDAGLASIVHSLVSSQHIIQLDLSSNGITDIGFRILFDCLNENESLIDLNVSNRPKTTTKNTINIDGLQSLSKLLKGNKILQILNISGLSLQYEGLYIIS